MIYRAPVEDILLALSYGAALNEAIRAGHYRNYDADTASAVIEEAGKFASDVLAPLYRVGVEHGATLKDSNVTTSPGWREAYRSWADAGWNSLTGAEEFGGQGLPLVLHAACSEIWSAANMSFGLCPLLTAGAIEAIGIHGADDLKQTYLAKLVSGEWTGTMQLTEPQAGSDVGALRTRAEKQPDGSYRLSGTKIFITYGDHDMTGNIVHLVLARLPGAPDGTKGISLFVVPKILVNADGSFGERNDIYASGLEHKLGIHGSPTCTMTMGDKGGAVGYLLGEENNGMACMFTMMNQARLGVGLEGVGIAERAAQHVRDARILTINEGTNGIQANDLVMRKLGADKGAALRNLLDELGPIVTRVAASNDPAFGATATILREALDATTRASEWLQDKIGSAPHEALAGATPYLRLLSLTPGGCMLARAPLDGRAAAALRARAIRRTPLVRFLAENVVVQASALEQSIIRGAGAIADAETALAD